MIDCSQEANGLTPVIGRAKFEILWITNNTDTIEDAPHEMTDDLKKDLKGNWTEWKDKGGGIKRWSQGNNPNVSDTPYKNNSFVDHFDLWNATILDPPPASPSINDYAPFKNNSIYFRPRSCFIFSNPVLVQ